MVYVQSATAEIRRGKKIETTGQKYNVCICYTGGHNYEWTWEVVEKPLYMSTCKFCIQHHYKLQQRTVMTVDPILTELIPVREMLEILCCNKNFTFIPRTHKNAASAYQYTHIWPTIDVAGLQYSSIATVNLKLISFKFIDTIEIYTPPTVPW